MTGSMYIPRPVLAAACCMLIALPFLSVEFPPITDLPQQAAQIRLFIDTLHDPVGSPYRIQWFTPNSLSYLVLGGSWAIFGAENAGRVAMLLVGILWIAAVHLFAASRERPSAAATLASVFFFNHIVYWGFYSFAVGWPVFLLWMWLAARQPAEKPSVGEALAFTGAAVLLYMGHVLWLIFGIAWFVLSRLAFRAPLMVVLRRLAYLAPLLVAIVIWYPSLAGSSMATPAEWKSDPISRIFSSRIPNAALGGIYGSTEYVLFLAIVVWVAVALWQNRDSLSTLIAWELMFAAALFLLLALVLPDKYMNTIRFWQRWTPMAMILVLLAAPPLSLRPILAQAAALIAVAALSITTMVTWMDFERRELSGLRDALTALPQSPSVIGLSPIKESELIRGSPFIQVFAYSQVWKGGMLNFSFAELSSSLVVHKTTFRRPWTGGLEWFPERTLESDLTYFDFLLMNAPDDVHRKTASRLYVTPVTREGRWRLYRIVH